MYGNGIDFTMTILEFGNQNLLSPTDRFLENEKLKDKVK